MRDHGGQFPSPYRGIDIQDGEAKRMIVSEIKYVSKCIPTSQTEKAHWDVTRRAGGLRIHNQLIIAKVDIDSFTDSELIEVNWIPIKNLEDYGAELFERSLPGNLEISMPTP
jgi:hypothetical protein